ncbi:MAG: class I SAM-dependent methyltransferase [Planctomycetota bacterium]
MPASYSPPSPLMDQGDESFERLRASLSTAYGLPDKPIPSSIHPVDEMFRDALRRREDRAAALIEYMLIGNQSAATIRQVARWCGFRWEELDAVLDFAAGYGRVSRFLLRSLPPGRLWIAEVLEAAVPFQEESFGVHGIRSVTDPQAVRFPRRFRFISALSLFTHLPRETFTLWLRRLCDAVDDGGVLLFTTHGPEAYEKEHGRPLREDFDFRAWSENDELDKNVYGLTFTKTEFVLAQIAKMPGIDLLGHLPRGLGNHQDIFVVGRGRTKPDAPLTVQPMPQGWVEVVHGPKRDGSIHFVGWGLDGTHREPLARVTVLADDVVLGDAELGRERDLSTAYGPQAARNGGWILSIPYGGWQPDWLTIAMDDAAGTRAVFTCPTRDVVTVGRE